MRRWQTFAGKNIFHQHDIYVYENLWYRWLTFNSTALQTLINKRSPHKAILTYIPPLVAPSRLQPGNTCLFGLGGGGVLHHLNHYYPLDNLVIIETSAIVIDVAASYFYIDRYAGINIIQQDAAQFIATTNQQFDHLLIDIYAANKFPGTCFNEQFFRKCLDHLSLSGVLAINIVNPEEQKIICQWLTSSPEYTTLVIPIAQSTNIICYAGRKKTIKELINKLHNSKQLKKLYWDSNWGNIGQFIERNVSPRMVSNTLAF